MQVEDNSQVEPVFHSAIDDHGCIQITFGIGRWPVPANGAREMLAKPVHPFADRFTADTNTPLRKEVFNICRTQRKPMIGSNRIGGNRSGKTEAPEARQI